MVNVHGTYIFINSLISDISRNGTIKMSFIVNLSNAV